MYRVKAIMPEQTTGVYIHNNGANYCFLFLFPPRDSTLHGRWTRKPYGLSRVHPIYLSIPTQVGLWYTSILFLNILTLLAPTQSADNNVPLVYCSL